MNEQSGKGLPEATGFNQCVFCRDCALEATRTQVWSTKNWSSHTKFWIKWSYRITCARPVFPLNQRFPHR